MDCENGQLEYRMNHMPQNIINTLNFLSTERVLGSIELDSIVRHQCKCFMHNDRHISLYILPKNRQDWCYFSCSKYFENNVIVSRLHKIEIGQI